MPYAIVIDSPGQTMAEYRRVQEEMGDEQSPGLIARAAGPTETGVRVIVIWETKAHADRFFAERVAPAWTKVYGRSPDSAAAFLEVEDLEVPAGYPLKA